METSLLLLEDNAQIRLNLSETLEELAGVRVVATVATEDEALRWLADHPDGWDLFVSDLFLQDGSGLRVLQSVRRARDSQKVIVFSNYVTPQVRKRCAQLGADAVFDKSTEIDALVDYCAQHAR
jgi:two-component system OmpR family response regulator